MGESIESEFNRKLKLTACESYGNRSVAFRVPYKKGNGKTIEKQFFHYIMEQDV